MKQLEEHFATNWVWWQQVSNKKTQHVSEGKLDRDSPICKKLHLPVVEIQNKASKYQIVNVLNISSLTVNDILKRFRDFEEISACMRQGQTSILEASDLWAGNWHKRHVSVMETTATTQ